MTEDSQEVTLKFNFLDVDGKGRRLISELIKNADEIGVPLGIKNGGGFEITKEESIGPLPYDSPTEKFDDAPSRSELKAALTEAGADPDLSAIDWDSVRYPLITSSRQELEETIEEKDSLISKLQEQKESLEDEKRDLKDVCQGQKEKIEDLEEDLSEIDSLEKENRELRKVINNKRDEIEELEQRLENKNQHSDTENRAEDLFEEAGLNEPEL